MDEPKSIGIDWRERRHGSNPTSYYRNYFFGHVAS